MSLLKKINIFFVIFLLFFSININYSKASSIIDERMNNVYELNKTYLNEVFKSKEEFELHFKTNYLSNNDDSIWTKYMRDLKVNNSNSKNEEKKDNSGSNNWWNNNNKNNSNSWKWFIVNESSDVIFQTMFWTSDISELQRWWILPDSSSKMYDTVVSFYWYLFAFFIIVWAFIIIWFIFYIISSWNDLFKKWWNKSKLEDFAIWFIIVVVVLFWWFRLYLKILNSAMRDIEQDAWWIWIETVDVDFFNWKAENVIYEDENKNK